MATFNLKLDRRNKSRRNDDKKFPLTVVVTHKRDVVYLPIDIRMTEDEYKSVFIKKSYNPKIEEFKVKCESKIRKAQMIFEKVGLESVSTFRSLFNDKLIVDESHLLTEKNELTTLYNFYLTEKLKSDSIAISTKGDYLYSLRVLSRFKTKPTLDDVTPEFLTKFEKWFTSQTRVVDGKKINVSLASVGNVCRSLKAVIKFAILKNITPPNFRYPFAEYSIKSYRPPKYVISNAEIQKVIDLEIQEPELEYARNVWVALYRMNGINYIDLLKFRWDDIRKEHLFFFRTKTKRTRKNNIRPISIHLNEKVCQTIDKIGDKSSEFILGLLPDDYTETYLYNKCAKEKKKINRLLKIISEKLNLSVPLSISEGRNAYANTLKRADTNILAIAEKMGHSSTETVVKWYLDSYDQETQDSINNVIL